MNNETPPKAPIPANVRVMIALVASPTLLVIGMLFYTLFVTGWRYVSFSMIIFSLLGFFAYYVALTGKLPASGTRQKKQHKGIDFIVKPKN